MAVAGAFVAGGAWAQVLPSGGVAIHGQAAISTPAPNQLIVTTRNGAGTGHSAINWQSFSLSAGSSARFVQPDAASLSINRVVTNTPSAIFGNLSSNGRMVLVNQSGITVGAGAVVDTAGFTASALRMTDADALAGRLRFGAGGGLEGMGGAGGLTVDGRITAHNGDVVLIAPRIDVGTSALVQSPNGATILAAGQQVEITGRGLEGISLLVQARDNEARNLGRLEGDAVGIFAGTLRHSGAIQATTATLDGGQVVLQATGDALVEGAGAILATGNRGGRIDVLGERVAVTDQALVDASGSSGGGRIRVGGDFQGKNPDIPNAQKTFMGPDATLRADATGNGDGGRVIVWSDDYTQAHGTISARGGSSGGDGGFVEVSGKRNLAFTAQVDTRAPMGLIGTLLLDPDFIDIDANGTAYLGDILFSDGSGLLSIDVATINTSLSNVILQANEDINFNTAVNLANPGVSLTARAGGFLSVNGSITTRGGAVNLTAGDFGSLTSPSEGSLNLNQTIDTTSGGVFPAGAPVTLTSNLSDVGGNSIFINANIHAGTSAVTLDALVGGPIDLFAGNIVGGDLNLLASFDVTQAGGSITASGVTTLNASNVSLTQAGNNFNVFGGIANTVSVTDVNGITLGSSSYSQLTVNANGNVGQNASVIVGGTTTINAGVGNVTLTTAGNNLNNLHVAGNALNIVEGAGSALTVLSLTSGLNQPVSLAAGHNLTLPAATIDTGTANLTLSSGNTLTIQGPLLGNNIDLNAVSGVVVDGPVDASGNLDVTVTGGASTMTVNQSISAGADMTLNLAGNLSVLAGSDGLVGLTAGGNQAITVGGNILLQGGGSGDSNAVVIETTGAGTQSVAANGITVLGGAGGGGPGIGNYASIRAAGSQTITAGNGGITLTGGGGTLSENYANIEQNGGAGTSQAITINGTGSIVLTGGAALGDGSHASILTDNGDSQTVTFTGGGAGRAITLTGGTNGSDAYAEIYAGTGTQSITGAGLITLTGGASGGGASFGGDTLGNVADISADANDQTIVANGIVVQGGAAGLNNLAGIFGGGDQSITVGTGGISLAGGGGSGADAKNAALIWKGSDVPGTSQTITVVGGGSVTLQGGSASTSNVGTDANFHGLSNGAFTAIRSEGISQLIEFTGSGSSITMTGGTVGSDNHARIDAITGTQTIRGDIAAHAPAISLQGGASGGIGGAANEGNRALIFALAGDQAITASSISLTGGAAGNENVAQLRQGDTTGLGDSSTQTVTVTGGGDLTMQGGGGTFNVARIRAHGTAQTVQFSAPGSIIDITGGGAGVDNLAQILANNGTQTVGGVTAADAPTISLQGGNAGLGNMAEITAPGGSQTISVGSGGLSLTGGSGAINDLRNFVSVYQGGMAGHSQTINVGGGGDIMLQAGSSASSGIGVNNGSLAYITSQGDQQLVEFSAPGSTISITGGTVGSYNTAGFYAFNGDQVVRGTAAANAPAIVMAGGASGGIVGEGNFAEMTAALGSQTLQAASIALAGGAAGTENSARILQLGVAGTSQSITIAGGGAVSLAGGGGVTNFAQFRSQGDAQTVDFAAGSSLMLTGGTGASLNFARIESTNGNQAITGSPDITITGGASGGAATLGNFAQLRARNAGTQTISANTLTIVGGAGGVENDAGIRNDAAQTVTLNGGASSNAIVIGSAAAANVSYITGNSQLITAGAGAQSGSITIHGGTQAGKNNGIFNNVGAQTVSTSGALTITGGSGIGSSNLCDATGGACAMISNSGAGLQTVTTGTSVLIQGGNAGVGNIAGIFVNAGDLTLDVGGNLTLVGGTGTGTNSASIGGSGSSGRTQTFNVAGNVVLDASNASDGSSAFIGLGGTGDLGTTVVDINSGGNVTLIGSNVSATSGAAIGAGATQTNATATVTIDAIDIVLNAGSSTGARIGHNSAANGPGNITLNATGNVALNSNGTIGAAIITTGNVTVDAGGNFTEGASSGIAASLLTASAGANMLLDSPLNQVGSLNATLPFFNTGDLFFTNALGTTLTVTGVAMAGTDKTARITADDLNITGAVSNIGGPVILRPLDLARGVAIENTPSGGAMSLSPAELQLVTNASVLEIGRLDSTNDIDVADGVASNQINVGTLRLLGGSSAVFTSAAGLGSAAAPLNAHVEVRANNNAQVLDGGIYVADNRNLQVYADNDGSGTGSVNIGAVTLRVGTGVGNTTGLMDVKGAGITVAVSGGGSALLEVTGAGNQTFTATDLDLAFHNLNAGGGNLTVQSGSGSQTFSAALGMVDLQAGTGTGASVVLSAASGPQAINADRVQLQGGATGVDNSAFLFAGGGAQTITAGAGGISLAGGGGTGGDGNNSAMITYSGTGTQTVTIAAGGDLSLTGGSSAAQNVGAGNGSRAIIESSSTGNQSITLAGGDLTLQGGSVGSRNYAALFAGLGSQTIGGVNNLQLLGGNDGGVATEGNRATIQAGVNQNISATSIMLTGGDDGTENYARVLLYGAGASMQAVNADSITLSGGIAGGGLGTGNFALIQSEASQTIGVANGGDLTLTGGGGTLTDNAARIETAGGIGTQAIMLTGGGSINMIGGSSTATTVGATHGSRALINANSTAQTIDLGGGSILMAGGNAGQRNFAGITAQAGTQTISNAAAIMMTGGTAGGVPGEGNFAVINSEIGNQSISTGTLVMTGGTAGTENLAQIRQGSTTDGLTASQNIIVSGTGALTLSGGSGNANLARIQAYGSSQSITMGAGAALTLTGGTGAGNNVARIQSVNGNQAITGGADITIQGGASGGMDLAGNFADIRASAAGANQTISASDVFLQAGASGQENFAGIIGANQNITATGDVSLTGGGSAPSLDGSSGGGARIGGPGGAGATTTNLTLSVGNNLTLTGGSVAGAVLGSSRLGGQATTISATVGGNITLDPGSDPNAGSRIGSPASGMAGGDIDLTAGGSITLGGAVAGETAIRTLGNVTLDATTLAIGNLVSGATIFANADGAATISGAGQLNAGALSGDTIELVAGSSFSNSAGASALVTTAPARWLVYSADPALDTRGGLVYDFKQYDKIFGDANPILGTGDGFLYGITPTVSVSLTGTVGKVYDGGNVATLAAGNFLATGGVDGDVVSVGGGVTGTYDNRNVGSGKTVDVSGFVVSALDGTAPVFGYALASGTASGAVGTITAAPLTVSTGDVNKTYDATIAAPSAVAVVTTGALVGGDTLGGGSFAFLDPNAGTGKTVTVSGVTVNDGNGGLNYAVTTVDNTNSSIAAANLTLGTSNVIKTYDGTTSAAGTLVVTGGALFGSDSVSGGNFAFTDKNAGIGNKVVTVGGAAVNDGNSGANYNVAYANNTTSTINRADISSVTGITAADKVYDGNTAATLSTGSAVFNGMVGGDVLAVTGASGAFADRNAGTGKPVAIGGITLSGTDAGNYNLLSSTGSATADITQASITIGTGAVNKPYDGTTSAAGSALVTGGALVGGDTLGGGTFAFLDPDVGSGKTVIVSGVTINDGNGGANYAVSFTSNTVSSITALAASTWSGLGGNNLWSNPANWDVLPVTGNVLSVSIPAGGGTVVFDAAAGTTNLQSLSSQQAVSVTGGSLVLGTSMNAPTLIQSGGTLQVGTSLTTGALVQNAGMLQVGTSLTTGTLAQSGGNLVVGGNLTTGSFGQGPGATLSGTGAMIVSNSFSQSNGSVTMGSIAINQTSGNLLVGSIAAPTITLSAPAGTIGQTAAMNAATLSTQSATGTSLNQAANQIGALVASNSGTGDIVLVNASPLTLGTIGNAGGNIEVVNTGAITTVGPVIAPAGDVTIIANSPLTVGPGGITAGGNIVLHATNLTSAGNLTLDGALVAGNTVSLTADADMVQNFSVVGANGVTAAAAGSMTYGPLATTNAPPILYTAGGVPVAPPPTVLASSLQAPGDIIVTFRELLQQAIDGATGADLETNPDGSKKKKDDESIVTEDELCR